MTPSMRSVVVMAAVVVVSCVGGGSAVCSEGYVGIDSWCFSFLVSKLVNWTEARATCEQLGGQLAQVETAAAMRDSYEYIRTYALTGDFWLGGTDQANEGDWLWTDSSRVARGTPFWAIESGLLAWSQSPDGGSGENCLVMQEAKSYYWDDISCSELAHPVCEE